MPVMNWVSADRKPPCGCRDGTGEVAQVDFGRMGMVFDPETGKQRVLHVLVVTLVFSRHQYVYLTHRQDLDALIGGMEEAWEFFGGITRRLILDNMNEK